MLSRRVSQLSQGHADKSESMLSRSKLRPGFIMTSTWANHSVSGLVPSASERMLAPHTYFQWTNKNPRRKARIEAGCGGAHL